MHSTGRKITNQSLFVIIILWAPSPPHPSLKITYSIFSFTPFSFNCVICKCLVFFIHLSFPARLKRSLARSLQTTFSATAYLYKMPNNNYRTLLPLVPSMAMSTQFVLLCWQINRGMYLKIKNKNVPLRLILILACAKKGPELFRFCKALFLESWRHRA